MLQLGGGCRVPIGAVGRAANRTLSLEGSMFTLDGKDRISAYAQGAPEEAEKLGKRVAQSLLKEGAKDIETQWRDKYGSW
jgi:hydroxymethylbilane synthase